MYFFLIIFMVFRILMLMEIGTQSIVNCFMMILMILALVVKREERRVEGLMILM